MPRPVRSNGIWKSIYSVYTASDYVLPDWARGGIGRREGLRILWRNPCRFDPCRAHQELMSKLLLIDDEEDVRYSFQRIFDSPEIEFATASSGEEGLKVIPKFKPDLVLM